MDIGFSPPLLSSPLLVLNEMVLVLDVAQIEPVQEHSFRFTSRSGIRLPFT